ncbi:hypothetical protein B0H13DRAFT_2349315 [Mycena leptocephala]|nr:hypothetical protein B0H13DRAFT_2349315 [Mycena leptocephala]
MDSKRLLVNARLAATAREEGEEEGGMGWWRSQGAVCILAAGFALSTRTRAASGYTLRPPALYLPSSLISPSQTPRLPSSRLFDFLPAPAVDGPLSPLGSTYRHLATRPWTYSPSDSTLRPQDCPRRSLAWVGPSPTLDASRPRSCTRREFDSCMFSHTTPLHFDFCTSSSASTPSTSPLPISA